MQLILGQYAFNSNSVKVTSESKPTIGMGQNPYGFQQTVSVDGFLDYVGQDVLTVQENLLRLVIAKGNYQNLGFYCDDGTLSGIFINNLASLTGLTVIDGPNFVNSVGIGPEYATLRSFNFKVMAEYILPGMQFELLNWTETLKFTGGGPLFVMKRALQGPPQRQRVCDQTEYCVEQSGEAEGLLAKPALPLPKWPSRQKMGPGYTATSPHRAGRGRKDYAVSWLYNFESEVPLIGAPTPWPGF